MGQSQGLECWFTNSTDTIEYWLTEFHAPDGKCRGTLADLILDADIIPRCGLIPPFRVVAAVLRTGGGMSPRCVWVPIEITEEDYWHAVDKLESMTTEDLGSRHRVRQFSGDLRPDYSAPDTEDYDVWADSLVRRRMV